MPHAPFITQPYRQGQRCIVFKNDAVSGATLGYYGTVLHIVTRSLRRHPDVPDLWAYRVSVPSLHKHLSVSAQDLYVTGEFDEAAIEDDPAQDNCCEIRFDQAPREDNGEIHGAYRLPGRDWELFSFQKREQSHATFELHMQVQGTGTGRCDLLYSV